jgi:hypothetical protein
MWSGCCATIPARIRVGAPALAPTRPFLERPLFSEFNFKCCFNLLSHQRAKQRAQPVPKDLDSDADEDE